MIATSAPPTLHHTNHEKNGIDEIDCTGLTGAGGGGGISLPTNEYRTYFDTLDAFSKIQLTQELSHLMRTDCLLL